MKSLAVLVVLSLVCVSMGWPIKPDDKALRMKEADEIADRDLDTWKEAVKTNNKIRLSQLTKAITETVKEAQKNNLKLTKGMGPLIAIMSRLATPSHRLLQPLTFMKLRALSLLTHLLDGNRDNFSYYRLEGIREWIERRTQEDGVQDMEQLTKAHESVIEARDALERMASTFVAGLKEIKEETSHILRPDSEKIASIAQNLVRVAEENRMPLIDKTQETEDHLMSAASKFFVDSDVIDVDPDFL